MIVYVEGIDERKDTVGVGMRLFDMFLEMDLDVPLRIARAKEGMGEGGGGMTRSVAVLVAAAGDIWQNAKVLIPNKSHTQEQEDVTALERYERARIIGARAL